MISATPAELRSQCWALAFGAGLLSTLPTLSFAAGENYERLANTTNIAQCPGKLVERMGKGSSWDHSWRALSLVCVRSRSRAYWVLLSSDTCSCDGCSEYFHNKDFPRLLGDTDFPR